MSTYYRARMDIHLDTERVLKKGTLVVQEVVATDGPNGDPSMYHLRYSDGGKEQYVDLVSPSPPSDEFEQVMIVKMLECIQPNPELPAEIGQTFRVLQETRDGYIISIPRIGHDDQVKAESIIFTKEPDFEGRSYKDWFKVVEMIIPI